MKNIVMLKTESVATAIGPATYKQGEAYLVEDWIANSLVGRGFAVIDQEKPEPMADDLSSMNIGQLRELAKTRNIANYRSMKKEELLARLNVQPPKSPDEVIDITGGKTPPTFTKEG